MPSLFVLKESDMKLKLICEIKKGFAFHYFGNPERVYIKDDKGHAIAPNDGRVRVSETTLVVPHEGEKKNDQE